MKSFKVSELDYLYEIFEDSRLYSIRHKKFLKPSISSSGYYVFNISINNTKKNILLHRLVCKYFVDNPNNENIVNHIDGNKLNNNIDNLEWCDYAHNNQHAHDNGLWKSTDRHKKACSKNLERGRKIAHKKAIRFTEEEGIEMLRLKNNGLSLRKIATIFETNHHTVKETIARLSEVCH